MGRTGLIAAFVCISGASLAAEATETLVAPPYPAQTPWQQVRNEHKASYDVVEWRPPDQVEGRGRDSLTQTILHVSKTSPSQHILMGFRIFQITCLGGVRINGPVERIEGGYSVAYGQAYCSNQAGTSDDLDVFIKAIRGHDDLFAVSRYFRRPTEHSAVPGVRRFSDANAAKAAMDEQAAANDFLDQVRLCPSVDPCPAPTAWPVDGKTSQSEVRERLGKPAMENQNPDGRHIDFYDGTDGLVRAYLYDKDNALINMTVHAVPKH